MKENVLNLVKEIDTHVQEAQRTPNKAHSKTCKENAKGKDKERILKAGGEKKVVTYRGVPIRLSADFSKETLQARRD